MTLQECTQGLRELTVSSLSCLWNQQDGYEKRYHGSHRLQCLRLWYQTAQGSRRFILPVFATRTSDEHNLRPGQQDRGSNHQGIEAISLVYAGVPLVSIQYYPSDSDSQSHSDGSATLTLPSKMDAID